VKDRYWGESINQFPGLNTEMIEMVAEKWSKDIQNEYGVNITEITLYGFQSSFASGPNSSEKSQNDDGTRDISSLKYAIVFFIDCPGEAQESGEYFACPHPRIASFISHHTSHIATGCMSIPDFVMPGIKAAYLGEKLPNNFEDEWVILPACTGPGCNGIKIPAAVRTDEPNLILYWRAPPKKVQGQESLEQESCVLSKCWMPKDPETKKSIKIDRLLPEKEMAVWNQWIKPIVDHCYEGTVTYKYVSGIEKITPDDFEVLWEQYLAPVICSNLPEWLEYSQSMDQSELESRISERIWGPDLFVSQVLWKIRAGMCPEAVEPFFNCLINIVAGKDLPTFLAYIDQASFNDNTPDRHRDQFTLPVPRGTTWGQIRFKIVNSDRVEVYYPGGMKPFSPEEAGLLKKKQLHRLLEKFAHKAYQDVDRQDIYNLNTFLKKMFPDIDDGNPIIKAKPGKKSLKEKKDQLKLKSPTGYTPVFSIQPE